MGRGKRHGGTVGVTRPLPVAVDLSGLYGVRVTELDFEKSAIQLELDGGKPDNGSVLYGPYDSEAAAEIDAARAREHYGELAKGHVSKWGDQELDWRVEIVPWPKGKTFSEQRVNEEARAQGVPPEAVDVRDVFGEPKPFELGGRSRVSPLGS